jgi:hypothetical protein
MKISLFAIFLVFNLSGYSQVRIINESLTDSTRNLLYIGMDNIIRFDKKGSTINYKLIIIGCEGAMSSIGSSRYNVNVKKTGTCTIEVLENGKRVLRIEYKAVELSKDGFATLAGAHNTPITKGKLLANLFVTITIPGSYYKHNYYIRDFQAVFIINGDSTYTSARGDRFNRQQKELANKLQPGDELWINHPVMQCASGIATQMPSFWLKIE